ncbi:MAG: selenoprotein B glycine/betaine/sarcosine/D-proline reductase [Chloroflexi bacterium]|nr:selenoprotein B glycine/betaine/sarcosine/D-proline reductase [Chloroflexota bacterium]MCI0778163.1 selenoprotein B glycine/betaine/sarcosine/D-proline reductase [Chloroflexota bacterium]MCI0855591.1 selenoprotein B glycine/betaine/sarcosine/D-proline reductase [Chloroflexota bacterium]MCI0890251.1 selenoprotein B glycine/betaine/sarcosine/D-proline reductase [Chloroflexota bacterium]
MVRLSDLPDPVAGFLGNMPMPEFESTPWVSPPPLRDAKVALVSTAGLHRRDDRKFRGGASDYRLIPSDVDYADLAMSHVSVNFDRSGYQQDVNIAFPLEHLHTLAANGEIGSVAQWHYSFMGATAPEQFAESGAEVGRLLKDDGVSAAVLIPI